MGLTRTPAVDHGRCCQANGSSSRPLAAPGIMPGMEDVVVVETGIRIGPIVATVIGVACAAFCLWLTVRIVNRRERWAKRTLATIVIGSFVYPLSAGPMFWVNEHALGESQIVYAIYQPLFWVAEHGPEWPAGLLLTYLSLFVRLPNC